MSRPLALIQTLRFTPSRLPISRSNGLAKLSVARGTRGERFLRHSSYNGRSIHSSPQGGLREEDSSTGKEQVRRHHPHHKPEPDMEEADSFAKEFDSRIPSNHAKPALSDAYQHSGKDAKHPKRPSREELSEDERRRMDKEEEDVQRHNEDMEHRHGRAASQITQDGKVETIDEMEEVRFKSEE
ncbi:hypothetical protein TMEN_4857 [Trichophyton mentagrophytes]|uniref:Uncharacterized protein n=1 Tax=Trichophyton interdigitale (strain MR816) TaxID=1215338 RepID=A0A059J5A5_TRIIM|nr:hypothetical protein H101_03061 [Trichophyton interdigitale H6]KDB22647.1 hypothetical protein H109_05446 [Trichophyton interdigitale MR816]GBF62319.1 hypothetical protein TMEN_4857 [Trichophyton mentagrophytes]